ncbi:MAG: sulfite exporter TauE/SafE family protein [Aquabacterium sp.]
MNGDPVFWLVAVCAVLLMGLSKSGFASGFGAMATPMLALVVPVPEAAAIMLPLLLVMDITSVQQLWRHRDSAQLRLLLPAGLLGTLLGMGLFKAVPAHVLAGVVGVLTLLFLAQRALVRSPSTARPPSAWFGRAMGVASGFTSFIAHTGSPPLNAYLLPTRPSPLAFAATSAVFFGAVNLAKWMPYFWLGLLNTERLLTSMMLVPLAPLGVWLGVRLSQRISPRAFFWLVYSGMLVTGLKLIWDGFRPH